MIILLAMVVGMVAGVLLRGKARLLGLIDWAAHGAIFLLLFLLGLSVGGNASLMATLHRLGLQALALTLGGIAGSVLCSAILYRRFFHTAFVHEK